jgi:energy-coupling factor transporter ATP-binding protein EcfA2
MKHIREYWQAEGLPGERLEHVLTGLADQHGILIPRQREPTPESPRTSLDVNDIEVQGFKGTSCRLVKFPTGFTCVAGPNDSGKSTLIQALEFALRGDVGTSVPVEALVQRGKTEAIVRVSGPKFVLDRRITDGKRSVVVNLEGEQTDKATEAKRLIALWLGMDVKVALATSIIGQGEMTSILDEAPGPRRELFYRMLGLDEYEETRGRLAKILAARGPRLAAPTDQIQGQIDALKKELAEMPVISERDVVDSEGRSILVRDSSNKAAEESVLLEAERERLLKVYHDLIDMKDSSCQLCRQSLSPETKKKAISVVVEEGKRVRGELEASKARYMKANEEATRVFKVAQELRIAFEAYRMKKEKLDDLIMMKAPDTVHLSSSAGDVGTDMELDVLVKTFSRSGYPLWQAKKHVAAVNLLADEVSEDADTYYFTEDLGISYSRQWIEGLHPKLDSGSARQRHALALRVAMSLYQAKLSGVTLPFLWVDEMPYQDEVHRVRCLDMLLRLSKTIGKVVLNCCTSTGKSLNNVNVVSL